MITMCPDYHNYMVAHNELVDHLESINYGSFNVKHALLKDMKSWSKMNLSLRPQIMFT